MSLNLIDNLISYAHSLGFERVGVTSADPMKKNDDYFKKWLSEGRAGDMDYMERSPDLRSRPADLLPGAKSVIALAMNYAEGESEGAREFENPRVARSRAPALSRSAEGRISRYALGRDYHKVMAKRLESFVRYTEALAPGVECRSFVDTGPLLERAFAQRAGLGFIGKNTMLITKGLGSWVFLASVLTTLELPLDSQDDRSCGECRLCIDACPTEAITAPFELDARRCISYLTIEHEGAIDPSLRSKMAGWIYGCDICQEVCPHNVRPGPLQVKEFEPAEHGRIGLAEILAIPDDDAFRKIFGGTAMIRAGRSGLIRNACLAAAHLNRQDLIPQLEKLSRLDPHAVVREQAAWALERLR